MILASCQDVSALATEAVTPDVFSSECSDNAGLPSIGGDVITRRDLPCSVLQEAVWGSCKAAMVITIVSTALYSFLQVYANDDQGLSTLRSRLTTITMPTSVHCGATEIASSGVTGNWVRDGGNFSHRRGFTGRCPFIEPRYNCEGWAHSANAWAFEPEGSGSGCAMPTLEAGFEMLAGQRVLMCGDSHINQLFIELLCLFEDRLTHFNGVHGPSGFVPEAKDSNYAREHYYPSEYIREWKKDLGLPANLGIDEGLLRRRAQPEGRPSNSKRDMPPSKHIGAANGTGFADLARFDNGFELGVAYLRGATRVETSQQDYATYCSTTPHVLQDFSSYPDPRLNSNQTQAALSSAFINSFDTIVSNTFIHIDAIRSRLASVGFRNRHLHLDKWSFGVSGGAGPRTSHVRGGARGRPETKAERHTDKQSGKMSSVALPALGVLEESRRLDAKAPIYPFTHRGRVERDLHGDYVRQHHKVRPGVVARLPAGRSEEFVTGEWEAGVAHRQDSWRVPSR